MEKKTSVGIGLGLVIIAIIIFVVFTNVGGMIGDMVSNTVSEVEFSNPLKTYDYNTKEEFACAVTGADFRFRVVVMMQEPSEERLEKYPNFYKELNEYTESGQLERDFSVIRGNELPKRLAEMFFPIFSDELSINPSLKGFVVDLVSGNIPDYEIERLENLCK